MKKVLVTLVLVMTLGVSVSFAQAAPVEVPVVEKPQQSKKLVFSEIYMMMCRKRDGQACTGRCYDKAGFYGLWH
mgnify:CR=1 FL=1